MSEQTKNKKKGRGRPVTTPWNKANLLWRSKTNSEIAALLGCGYQNVYAKRQKLIAKAILEGKTGESFKFKPKNK